MKPIILKSATLLLIALIACSASAYDFKAGNLCYNINSDGKTVTVTYQNETAPRYTGLTGALNIPTSVKNGSKTYSVTAIGENAFEDCAGITSLNIPNSVTSVAFKAFWSCTAITTVTVGNSARSWGDYVFAYCSGLTTINWNVPDGVSFTFGGGTGMLSYGNPFYHTGNVKTVVFGNNVKRIPACFCRNFGKLTSVTIPSSVTYIGTWAFAYCNSLPKVTLPAAVDTIGYGAFTGCENLSSLTIPNSVTYIGNEAFTRTAWFNNQPDGVVYAGNMAYSYKGTMPANTAITLKDNCIGLACQAFANQKNLKTITLGKNIKHFNWNGSTFKGCTGLTTVNWNVTDCDNFSNSNKPFADCTGITTFNFGNTVKRIPEYLCYSLSNLTKVSIGKAVTGIGSYAFGRCEALTRVDISDAAAWCNIDFGSNGANNPLYYAHNLYLNGSKVNNFVVPGTVTDIKPLTFYGGSGLTGVTIPSSVKSIGQNAFAQCTELTRVDISDAAAWCNIDFGNTSGNPLYYAHNLYLNGSKVNNFVVPGTVTDIKPLTFYGGSGLTGVTIPSSVKSIGQDAFAQCTGLTRVDCSDLVSWLNIDFDGSYSNPLYFAKCLYVGGEQLSNLVIPATINKIKPYAFYNCKNLTSLTIPEGVSTIGRSAFYSCSDLTSASIPASVTVLGDHAFRGCNALSTMVTRITRPQDLDYQTNSNNMWHFNGVPSSCTLYVPAGSLEYYNVQAWDNKRNPWVFSVKPTFGTITEFVEGDINFDGVISVADVSEVYSFIIGGNGIEALCDLNVDGVVNASDVSSLYDRILTSPNE